MPETTQYVARIVPGLPPGSPANITLSMITNGRKQFFAEQGFVPVESHVVPVLKRVHTDGRLTEQGGKGGKLFEVVTEKEAMEIVYEEEQRMLLQRSGAGGLAHAELRALAAQKQAEERIAVQSPVVQSAVPAAPNADPSVPEGPKVPARVGRKRVPR